jgi:hypothetical protein
LIVRQVKCKYSEVAWWSSSAVVSAGAEHVVRGA